MQWYIYTTFRRFSPNEVVPSRYVPRFVPSAQSLENTWEPTLRRRPLAASGVAPNQGYCRQWPNRFASRRLRKL